MATSVTVHVLGDVDILLSLFNKSAGVIVVRLKSNHFTSGEISFKKVLKRSAITLVIIATISSPVFNFFHVPFFESFHIHFLLLLFFEHKKRTRNGPFGSFRFFVFCVFEYVNYSIARLRCKDYICFSSIKNLPAFNVGRFLFYYSLFFLRNFLEFR